MYLQIVYCLYIRPHTLKINIFKLFHYIFVDDYITDR